MTEPNEGWAWTTIKALRQQRDSLMANRNELIVEFKAKLQEQVQNDDPEVAHTKADKLICELLEQLGYGEIVEIYEKVTRWYG